jgi:uncharacterized protein (TIGR02118 family)
MISKLNILFTVLIFLSLTSCKNRPISTAGTFKVSILYPAGEDKTFDMSYYEKTHMPMVAGFIGKNLKFYQIDKGLAGRTPNEKAVYVAIGYFFIKDVAEYNKAISQNRDAIVKDFKNYTNIQPIIQISEIKQVVSGKLR